MGLARLVAVVSIRVLLRCRIAPLADTLEQVQPCSLQALQRLPASVGQQARSSRIPPLVRTYKNRIKLKGPKSCLPNFSILQRTKDDVSLGTVPDQGYRRDLACWQLNTFPRRRRGDQTARKLICGVDPFQAMMIDMATMQLVKRCDVVTMYNFVAMHNNLVITFQMLFQVIFCRA